MAKQLMKFFGLHALTFRVQPCLDPPNCSVFRVLCIYCFQVVVFELLYFVYGLSVVSLQVPDQVFGLTFY